MQKKYVIYGFAAMIFLSVVMHLHIFPKDLWGKHLWRQAQTQECVQQFTRGDFNILNPRTNTYNGGSNIVRLEFPIMQWSIAAINRLIGESILTSRIFMFCTGLLGIFGFYLLLFEIFKDRLIAFCGSFAFSFSPVFYYYTVNPLPDVFGLSMGILSLALFFQYKRTKKNNFLIGSAILMSFSILAKLPFIMFGVVPATYFIQEIFSKNEDRKHVLLKLFVAYAFALIAPVLWYGWVMKGWGTTTVIGGILNKPLPTDKLLFILKHHYEILWPRLLLGYSSVIVFFIGVFYILWNGLYKIKNFWLFFNLLVILFAFFAYEISIIDVGHDYYLFPFLPALFIIVTFGIKGLYTMKYKFGQVFLMMAMIAMPIHAFFTVDKWWSREYSYFDQSLLEDREYIRALIPQGGKCIMLNDYSGCCMISYLIDKEGYTFDHSNLPALWVEDMVKNFGVRYLVSTTREVDTREDMLPFYESLIYHKGFLRIYKLKDP